MANYTLDLAGQQVNAALNEVHNNKVIKNTAQSLTDSEKTQARTNIGAGAASDVSAIQSTIGTTTLPTTAQTLTGAIAEVSEVADAALTYVEALDAPVISGISSGVITFSEITGATSYKIYAGSTLLGEVTA